MTDSERIATLERDVQTLRTDLAALAAQLTLLSAKVDRKEPRPVNRGGWPVVG
jgi:hypothetical protein